MIIEEPADAVFEEFPCWFCGGETSPTYLVGLNLDGSVSRHQLATRLCEKCQVTELRRARKPRRKIAQGEDLCI
jgi:hypothetical protein